MAQIGETKQAILRYIRDYMAEHTWAPTVREIGPAVGLRSIATVHDHLHRLVELGYIEMGSGPRMIRFPRSKPI
jgi:repressor LexA